MYGKLTTYSWNVTLLLILLFLTMVACSRSITTVESTPTPVPTPSATAEPTQSGVPAPTVTASSEPTPTATFDPSSSSDLLTAPPDRDLYSLAQRLRLKSPRPLPRVVNLEPVTYQEGHQDTFWITDSIALKTRSAAATLRVVSDHAYWYVEDGLSISTKDLRQASTVFEETIYPTATRFFGEIWSPGVDNDPHLIILHTRIPGLAGYYSSSDEYPKEVQPRSNEREIIYLDGQIMRVGSSTYLGTLAHELQHATHWNADPNEESWVNEGLSEVAKDLAGYRLDFVSEFLRGTPAFPLGLARRPAGYPASLRRFKPVLLLSSSTLRRV